MNTMNNQAADRPEIETLLPWHAAGTLNRRDAQRVEQALAQDPALARQFELVREDLTETIHLNESLGAPSARAMEKLFAAIEADEIVAPKRVASFSLSAWFAETFGNIAPRKLAFSATAAALIIAVQAGFIGSMFLGGSGSGVNYGTASHNEMSGLEPGTYALIGFHPGATAGEIQKFLEANKLVVVDGPRGGFYRVRIATTAMSKEEVAQLLAKMREDAKIVRFISPSPPE